MHEASRSINHKATQNNNNTATTPLERSVAGALKYCQLSTNFTQGPDVFLNTKLHKKFGSHNGSLT